METQPTRLQLVHTAGEVITTSDIRQQMEQRLMRTAMRKAFEQVLNEVADGDRDADLWDGLQMANLKSDYISPELVSQLNHRYNGSITSLFDKMYEIIHSDHKIVQPNISA